jgi:putative CRISPR-associated protein (TIGR02619 family)
MSEKNHRIIISTVGTSLLTNQIDRIQESSWFGELARSANARSTDLPPATAEKVATLARRARDILQTADLGKLRRASAELNGILGIYDQDFSQGKADIHYLIATDTAQGQRTAEIIRDLLANQGVLNVNIPPIADLSTASTGAFSEGIDGIIQLLERDVKPLMDRYEVIFNLTGGFKSLQGYMNTLGMFYADRIVYIFEGENAELITIPRLPIAIDDAQLAPHAVTLVLLAKGDGLPLAAVQGIPETLVAAVDGRYILSNWGNLLWQQQRERLLGYELLDFPGLVYRDRFRADFKNGDFSSSDRLALQETLARVSYLFRTHGNSTQLLVGGGLQYSPLANGIGHFRINLDFRVTCRVEDGMLVLCRYGHHSVIDDLV